jgi:hypothetical protein
MAASGRENSCDQEKQLGKLNWPANGRAFRCRMEVTLSLLTPGRPKKSVQYDTQCFTLGAKFLFSHGGVASSIYRWSTRKRRDCPWGESTPQPLTGSRLLFYMERSFRLDRACALSLFPRSSVRELAQLSPEFQIDHHDLVIFAEIARATLDLNGKNWLPPPNKTSSDTF